MGLKASIARNFRKPTGIMGWLIGKLMNKGNDFMNRFTIGFLDPQPSDRILEIGFGNGKYMREIAEKMTDGLMAGVDYSRTMVDQAKKRNRSFIRKGVVDIKLGEVNRIPFDTGAFDKVFTVNTIYFWPNPDSDIQEIRRILKPGGRLLIAFRSKEKMEKLDLTRHGFTLYEPEQVKELARRAGFIDIRLESSEDGTMDVNCLIAVKPAEA